MGISESGQARLHSLDLLRGLCALGVAAYHFSLWSTAPLPHSVKSMLALFGTYGVSVFFILSGYSLAHAHTRHFDAGLTKDRLQAYFRRRLGRLGPLFGLVVLVSLAGKVFVTGHVPGLYVIIANLALVFGIVNPAGTPVVGGWSIGVEVVYYIVLPLLLVLRHSAHVIAAAAVFLSAWVSYDIQAHATLADAWNLYVHPANHVVFFVIGVYMRLYDHRFVRIENRLILVIIVVLLMVMAMAAAQASELELVTGWRRLTLVAASLAFVGLVARLPLKGVWTRLSEVMGGLSYPLYLLHPIVFFAVRGRVEMMTPVVFGLLLGTVVLAAMADRWVDGPTQRRVKAVGW